MLYSSFWIIPRLLNSEAGELPRRKNTTIKYMFKQGHILNKRSNQEE
jgi:hypothetical protein